MKNKKSTFNLNQDPCFNFLSYDKNISVSGQSAVKVSETP